MSFAIRKSKHKSIEVGKDQLKGGDTIATTF